MVRSDVDPSAAEEDHGDECGGGVEAEGAARDGADLAVEAFDASVVQARADVLEDSVDVGLDSAGDADEVDEIARARLLDPRG